MEKGELKVCDPSFVAPIAIAVYPLSDGLALRTAFLACLGIDVTFKFGLQRFARIWVQCQFGLSVRLGSRG